MAAHRIDTPPTPPPGGTAEQDPTGRIATWVTHRWVKWVILAVTLLLAGSFASLGAKISEVTDNDIGSWLPGNAESTQVIEESAAFQSSDLIPALVVYTRSDGVTQADQAKAAADATALADVESVNGEVVGPIPSEDGQALQLVVPVELDAEGWTKLPGVVDDIRTIAEEDAAGLNVAIAGPAALGADQAEAFSGIDGVLLYSALGVVVILLLLTYRSPVLWIIPLFAAVASLLTAQGTAYLLGSAGLNVNDQTTGILSVLVLGAGTDYALLLIARYREELRNYEDRHEAMAHALHRAGPAIIASGATVVIGLLCLLFAEMNSTSSLGPVSAAGIGAGLLMMLTLLPALLVIFGRWVFWPRIPRYGDPAQTDRGFWARVGRRIAVRPRTTWVVTVIILGVCTLGVFQLNANGLSNAEAFTTEQPSIAAEEELAEHFPAGGGSPVYVLANADQASDVRAAVAGTEGIVGDSVSEPVVQGDRAFIQATLSSAPDSGAAFDTVDRVRESVRAVDGAEAIVGGDSAINHDVQDASAADNRLIIPVILVAVFLILAVLLRALAAPAVLLATVVLSFGAALGIAAFFFHNIFGFAGADSSFPLFAFVFLVALGIDYNIFLMTRVREESMRWGTRRGALIGLAATGGVITSAGLVLAGTFAALATLPIVFLAELGFAVAIGVLLDAVIVRAVLVTALNLDIGRVMWWPSRLWREDKDAVDDVSSAEAAAFVE